MQWTDWAIRMHLVPNKLLCYHILHPGMLETRALETRNDGRSDRIWQRREIQHWRLAGMKEVCRALPITKWERRKCLQGTLLYFRMWCKPEPVTTQTSGNQCEHIYTPSGCGEGNGRERKSSCGLTLQIAKATGGSQIKQGSLQFSTGDMMPSQGCHIPERVHFYSTYLWFIS